MISVLCTVEGGLPVVTIKLDGSDQAQPVDHRRVAERVSKVLSGLCTSNGECISLGKILRPLYPVFAMDHLWNIAKHLEAFHQHLVVEEVLFQNVLLARVIQADEEKVTKDEISITVHVIYRIFPKTPKFAIPQQNGDAKTPRSHIPEPSEQNPKKKPPLRRCNPRQPVFHPTKKS